MVPITISRQHPDPVVRLAGDLPADIALLDAVAFSNEGVAGAQLASFG